MYTHQLIELLKTFSAKEIMWFGKFLNSPYFNNRKMLIKLFLVLKRYYPEFEGRKFTKEDIYSSVYGKIKYNDSTFRNLMSDLLQLTLQFVKLEGIEKNVIESDLFLSDELFERGNVNLLMSKIVQTERSLEKRNVIDSEYFMSKFKLNATKFFTNMITQKTTKKSYVTGESEILIESIVFMLCYFVMESLKHNEILLNYSRSYNIKKNIDTVSDFLDIFKFDKIIKYIRENSNINIPVIEIYFKLLETFLDMDNSGKYFDFKKTLLYHSKNLGTNENNFLHSRLIDYCITKKNKGASSTFDLDREIFELQKIFIKKEYYKSDSNSYLTLDLYRNVLLNCITIRELHYMEEFISKYSKKLIPMHITNVENYSYALLYFEKESYSKALNCINKVTFDQFVFKVDMKNLQLKINYELEYFESAISVIDSYKHFLKNNQLLSENRKILHNNFVAYTLKLIHYRTGSKKVSLSFLSDRIKKSKNTFDKGWLLEKIKQLSAFEKKHKS
ncbi:MAG: hypothetical protein WBQ38_02250 [Ignavibacteria bacterium]